MGLSNTAFVILGMLQGGAKSGYDIKALVDRSTRFFWVISYGQIYPELKRLEEQGLVEGTADPSDGRRRKAYTLTEKGERTVHDWLTSPGPLHFELRHEGILRLFFAGTLDRDEQIALLRKISAEHERVRAEIEESVALAEEHRCEKGDSMPLLTAEVGVAYQSFYIDMCRRLEQRLAELTDDPEGS